MKIKRALLYLTPCVGPPETLREKRNQFNLIANSELIRPQNASSGWQIYFCNKSSSTEKERNLNIATSQSIFCAQTNAPMSK